MTSPQQSNSIPETPGQENRTRPQRRAQARQPLGDIPVADMPEYSRLIGHVFVIEEEEDLSRTESVEPKSQSESRGNSTPSTPTSMSSLISPKPRSKEPVLILSSAKKPKPSPLASPNSKRISRLKVSESPVGQKKKRQSLLRGGVSSRAKEIVDLAE